MSEKNEHLLKLYLNQKIKIKLENRNIKPRHLNTDFRNGMMTSIASYTNRLEFSYFWRLGSGIRNGLSSKNDADLCQAEPNRKPNPLGYEVIKTKVDAVVATLGSELQEDE